MKAMGLFYPVQQDYYVIGSASAAATLTTAYSGNVSAPFPMQHYSQLTFFVDYTPGAGGSGNSVQIQVEGSPDLLDNPGVTPIYYIESDAATSTGVITHTIAYHTFVGAVASTSYKFMFYVPPAYKTIRVSAKETVVGGSAGTVKIRALNSGG